MYLAIDIENQVIAYADTLPALANKLVNADYDDSTEIDNNLTFFKAEKINIIPKVYQLTLEVIE